MCGLYTQRGECYRFRPYDWMVPSHKIFEDVLKAHTGRRSHGHVVPNGIDTARFRPQDRRAVRRELGLENGPLLVSVGRLNVEKGVDLAIRATAEANGSGTPARLVVVGDGEERTSLERIVDSLGVRQQVTFVGAQPHERVAAYMAAADVFLFPTLRDEAAPLVLPQAMACATPVIASAIGGITEVVKTDGRNGILIPPGDQQALVAAVQQLLDDPARRRAIGEAGRRRVEAEYTIERMVERSVEVYETARQRLASRRR
jgi:glycosyltransferase involved in cell wall biosynthesis